MELGSLLREGKLEDVRSGLHSAIRQDPVKAEPRIFLFQLEAIMGRWEKSLNQLNVLGDLDAGTLAMVQTYRETLHCEAFRQQVFAGERTPIVFGEPAPWLAEMIEALRLSAKGERAQIEHAEKLRVSALEKADASAGTINGEPFEWLSDADSRIGPVLEVIIAGRYNWLPFEQLKSIQFDEPSDLRDFVWNPAHLTFVNGGTTVAFVPTRYSGSEESGDAMIKLARRTEWQEKGSQSYFGLGQRMFSTDRNEYPLLSVREIVFDRASQEEREG